MKKKESKLHEIKNCGKDWIVYVNWKTITDWKKKHKNAVDAWGPNKVKPKTEGDPLDDKYPFQYASKQQRFMNMSKGDRLWLVTLPKFDGFCQPPSIMACLNLEGVYDRKEYCAVNAHEDSAMRGRFLAVGKPGRVIDTYPPLYNIFDVLINFKFEGGKKDLKSYKAWLKKGDFRTRGPYYRIAQHFRTLRQLSPSSGRRLQEIHKIGVEGRRIFLSYKISDFINRSDTNSKTRNWMKSLVDYLERMQTLPWWDGQQMIGKSNAWKKQARLISALLDDGVKQAVWFVALGTQGYGSKGISGRRWTLEEWNAAGREIVSNKRRHELNRLLIEFGENDFASLLPEYDGAIKRKVVANTNADEVASLIQEVITGN